MDYFQSLYKSNDNFKGYVDRCAKAHGENVENTLQRLTVQNVGRYYVECERDKVQTKTVITAGCGGAE